MGKLYLFTSNGQGRRRKGNEEEATGFAGPMSNCFTRLVSTSAQAEFALVIALN